MSAVGFIWKFDVVARKMGMKQFEPGAEDEVKPSQPAEAGEEEMVPPPAAHYKRAQLRAGEKCVREN